MMRRINTMGLNMLLLLAMVATNILSLYQLSSTLQYGSSSTSSSSPLVPDHLLHQLQTIHATINHLTRLQSSTSSSNNNSITIPSDLLLHTRFFPIASSCKDHLLLLHQFMNYTPFSICPNDNNNLAESLILRGCHPLPRRRCFSRTSSPTSFPTNPFASLPESSVLWSQYTNCKSFNCLSKLNSEMGFDMMVEKSRFLEQKSDLDLPISQLMQLTKSSKVALRLAIDIGGATGTFSAQMKFQNVTVLTTTMNLGAPYNEAASLRGLVPLHVPLQQRLPVFDGVVDLVRCGHAVNRWIPLITMEFLLFDVDRVLRNGGYFLLDHFFSKKLDLEKVYTPLIGNLGYKKVKWTIANKTDSSGLRNGEVYLTALLQKPMSK